MNITTAHAIAADVRTALPNALVTLDQSEAIPALTAGTDVVFIQPPTIERDTAFHATATWEVLVVPGTRHDRVEAWADLDGLVEPLLDVLDVDRARPYDWRPDDGGALPAYELTFTTDHDLY